MNKKQKSERNRHLKWYGLKKLKAGQKACWLAKQDKNGWAIGLAFNSRTLWLRNFRASSKKEVERIMEKSSLVFINLKNNHAKS